MECLCCVGAVQVYSVAIAPDGQTVVSGSADRTVRLWSLHSGECLRVLEGHSGAVSTICRMRVAAAN